jgi:transcriptional regulator with XRE-family HTH domain
MAIIKKYLTDIGLRISVTRRLRGLRQQDIAEISGIGLSTIAKIEKGSPHVEIGSYLLVFQALGFIDDISRLGTLSASDVDMNIGHRVKKKRQVFLLQADHRKQKTRQQQEFIKSGHPGARGFWKNTEIKLVHIPPIED